MEEPSVLDYIKSKLAFWKPSTLEIPGERVVEDEPSTPPAVSAIVEKDAEVPAAIDTGIQVAPQGGSPTPAPKRRAPVSYRFPWLTFTPLLLALVAQMLLEPPDRQGAQAMVLYLIAAAFLVSAYLRRDFQPEEPPAGQKQPDDLQVRPEGLIVGGILTVLAFITFGVPIIKEHDFNLINTSFWLVGLGYLAWGFAIPRGFSLKKGFGHLRGWVAQPGWRITIGRWGLLLLVVSGLIIFFRFYRLDNLPAEMVSDHAEKLLDVHDVLSEQLHVFFPRNTGREAYQFYLTSLMSIVFGTGVSFMSLKIGTSLMGLLTLYYMYRTGVEIGNRWVGLFAVLFAGFGYWPNIIARIGLRFPLYPAFLAPMLFFLVRGLRNANRNDFIWAGLWLGAGLHGYTSYRIVPLVVVAAFLIYLLHERSPETRKRILLGFLVVVVLSAAVFLPLGRYALDNWDMFAQRSLTRLSDTERPLPGPILQIFFGNLWNAVTMFFYNNGDVWVHSIPGRPAMDVISAALFFLGAMLALIRYIHRRLWLDLFLLVSIPILLLPSILSLAFPNENPNLNRTAGAYVPAFLLLALGMDAMLKGIRTNLPGRVGSVLAAALAVTLVSVSMVTNYNLVFGQYDQEFRNAAWNTSEMGQVMRDFDGITGLGETNVWVVAYPYWVDTRLVAINAGYPTRDTAVAPDNLGETVIQPGPKLYMLNTADQQSLSQLMQLYPEGRYWQYESKTKGKEFLIFLAPPRDNLPLQPAP